MITIVLFTNSRSRNSTSISATRLLGRDVERGGELVGDQERRVRAASRAPSRRAASSRRRARSDSGRGRCRRGRRARGGGSARAASRRTRRRASASSSEIIRPILRIGLSALIAYCGTIETSRKRNAFIALSSASGSSTPSSSTVPSTHAHPPVEPDQALAERRLAAARLAGDAHDLAVGDGEA